MVSHPLLSEEGCETGLFEQFHILRDRITTYRLPGRDVKNVKSDSFTSFAPEGFSKPRSHTLAGQNVTCNFTKQIGNYSEPHS